MLKNFALCQYFCEQCVYSLANVLYLIGILECQQFLKIHFNFLQLVHNVDHSKPLFKGFFCVKKTHIYEVTEAIELLIIFNDGTSAQQTPIHHFQNMAWKTASHPFRQVHSYKHVMGGFLSSEHLQQHYSITINITFCCDTSTQSIF